MCPDSSLSLRKPLPLPSLLRTWAHMFPKLLIHSVTHVFIQKQITQQGRVIQHNSHGICPHIYCHHCVMCTDTHILVPTRVHMHVHFHPMDIHAPAHRSCTGTKPYIRVHVFIPIQQTYMFISPHLGTHVFSTSYTKSSPNKNFIHCSQVQH